MHVESESAAGLAACWICGSRATSRYKPTSIDRKLVAEDLRISDANYGTTLGLWRCAACGFVFADSAQLGELEQLYAALDDPGYEQSQTSRTLQMRWLLDAAQRACPGARSVLDVGAGAGLLVKLARERGLAAEGVEPSRQLVDAAARLHGVDLLQGTLPHPRLEGRRFDLVFLVDVIEHVADPRALLEHARALLGDDGRLLLVTPELGSIAQRLLGFRWWHFRLAHVCYFDRPSLERACELAGLGVVERFRAKWFFEAGYLAERTTRYLPLGGLARRIGATAIGQRASKVVVPLNLFDSWAFVCRKSPDPGRSQPDA